MDEYGMYEVHAIRIENDTRVTEQYKPESEVDAFALARAFSRMREYAWVEVYYMGGEAPQRIRVFVKGHSVLKV